MGSCFAVVDVVVLVDGLDSIIQQVWLAAEGYKASIKDKKFSTKVIHSLQGFTECLNIYFVLGISI